MSERDSSPEVPAERLQDNCNNCKQDYDLTPENASLHLHEVNPDCNHLKMMCTNCNHRWVMFGLAEDTETKAVQAGLPIEYTRFPSDGLLAKRLGFLGIELVQPVEITPRHEQLVAQLGQVLENAPDDLLYGFITDDNPNRPHPPRWN